MLHRPGVIDLLARQHWVATLPQFAALGVSRQRVADAVACGLVCRVARGVVGIGGHCDSFMARCTAIGLTAPPGSFLSSRTAARLHGLRRMPESPIEVCLPEARSFPAPDWVRIEHSSWSDDWPRIERDDALVVASPWRMLFGLAATLTEHAFLLAAEDAWHLGLVDPTSAASYLAAVRRRGRTGVARFEAWLERADGIARPATTSLERLLLHLARRAGLPEPARQHPVRLARGEVIHLDLAWPDLRFAIEPGHSWWHGGDAAQRADQGRDRRCAEVGWHVVRFDESVWERQADAVRQMTSMYRARERELRARPA